LNTLSFYKYQGTGNDFVLVDDRQNQLHLTQEQIAQICHRRFGIGADGFILLRSHEAYDFEMVYYNSDGRTSSMCGNGGRCIARFAADLGVPGNRYRFLAIDGAHEAEVGPATVSLKMQDVAQVSPVKGDWYLDTGSPHYVAFADAPEELEILSAARAIRNSPPYQQEGVNVNFIALRENGLYMRTYERGVEDETYSCGTGVTAAALVAHTAQSGLTQPIQVSTKGGQLSVSFEEGPKGFSNIWLRGPAEFVFKGTYRHD